MPSSLVSTVANAHLTNMQATSLNFKRSRVPLAVILGVATWTVNAKAVFFDLRGLSPNQSSTYTLTVGGITAQLQSGLTGKLTSGASTFGLDLTSALDDPALIDGGSGSAESVAFLFSQYVLFESILISRFDSVDHGTFNIKGGSTITLTNGVNSVGAVTGGSSANYLRWTGDAGTGSGRGFSVDGFTVRLVGTGGYQANDYNINNRVDAADYVLWRKMMGTSYTQNDYANWRAKFGQSVSGSGSVIEFGTVPEPAAISLLAIAVVIMLCSNCRRAGASAERV